MSSSSGNSSGSCPTSSAQQQQLVSGGSEGDMQNQHVMDQRKRKRMQSNRESARRSRMRKQKLLDDLTAQVGQLRKESNEIMSSINVTTQHYLNVEAENAVLRAQMAELNQRLESLNEILNFINSGGNGVVDSDEVETASVDHHGFMNPMNLLCVNHPIMASADMMMY